MGVVTIQEHTPAKPINMIGMEAGVCWGADITDEEKNRKRGLDCLRSGHMRTAEFPQIYMILDGYSARVIREFYTHIAGGPTRLQASTRYIDYTKGNGFEYINAPMDTEMTIQYQELMKTINDTCKELENKGAKREDVANLLPLGMTTKVVVRTNLRHLIEMSHQRLCTRAYWEFRQLMRDIMDALCDYSLQWNMLVAEFFKPKCEVCGFCTEKDSCGRKPSEQEVKEFIEIGKKWKNPSEKNFKELIAFLSNDEKEDLMQYLFEEVKKI